MQAQERWGGQQGEVSSGGEKEDVSGVSRTAPDLVLPVSMDARVRREAQVSEVFAS